MIVLLAACTPTPEATPTATPTPEPSGARETLTLPTRDGVDLVGDLYPGDAGAAGIVLLHMTPAGPWNRQDWPATFIDALRGHGWWVVALDRRGAGDSQGVAQDAFTGPAGRYDVEAAVKLLEERGAGAPALIGASNGTTSALDYTLWAESEGLPEPVALGFMTGGTYTENQNELPALDLPVVFTYSTAERAWSVDQQAGAPASWSFLEYPDGDHGTLMFEAKPEVAADLESFLAEVL